ncbi:hypothetical protein [Pontiella sulfatireligans]|nr:hypothetical protein [Pontiella sulfatireligans]
MKRKTTWIIAQIVTFCLFFVLLGVSAKFSLAILFGIYLFYPITWASICSLVERRAFPINWKRNSIIRILSVVIVHGAITFFILENMPTYQEPVFIVPSTETEKQAEPPLSPSE